MPTKGMRSIFAKATSPISMTPPSSPRRHSTFSESLMEENIEMANLVITKWQAESYDYAHQLNSIFNGDRREAREYLRSVNGLQAAMHFYVTERLSSDKLVLAQHLMQGAMKRLEKEFYVILSSNRDYLDPESVSSRSSRIIGTIGTPPRSLTPRSVTPRSSNSDEEDLFKTTGDDDGSNISPGRGGSLVQADQGSNMAMSDLKAIANCMISSGYGKECVKIYKLIRKSIIDEGLYNLGVERMNFHQVRRMDWHVLEAKIKRWLHAVKISVKTLFYGERILCDHVFESSPSITEACFTEISKEGALSLFGFPELVAKCKKSPEKMFRILDLYETISDLWPEIESIFCYESTTAIKSQAISSLVKLGEAVQIILSEFETAIQKESSKSVAPGGGIHPLTRYVMNYLSFLSEYSGILTDMSADWPSQSPGTDNSLSSIISDRLAWLILVLQCKLDVKARLHEDVALSYLFLANNLQYIVAKVRSSNMKFLLGDEWMTKHEIQVSQYAANYERMGWNKVLASLPVNPEMECSPDMLRNYFRRFNSTFEEAYRRQGGWVVTDSKLRDEIKVSIAKKIMPAYRELCEEYRALVAGRKDMNNEALVRFAPDDLENYLSDLFHGDSASGSSTPSVSQHGRRSK